MFVEHLKPFFLEEKNVVLNENSVEGKPCISQFSYAYVMINMKLLSVVTPPSIYHDSSTRKTFWEEKFTGEEKLFLAVNMNNSGCRNVSKHKEIKGSDKYVTFDISLKFDQVDKMKITSSESK